MFRPPLRELRFVMHELLRIAVLEDRYADIGFSADLADNILEEAANFAENVLEPLHRTGDREGARWTPEGVVTPQGFREAYAAYVEAGWPQLSIGTDRGGQGMPQLLNTAVEELMFAANMGFFLGTSLARGAVEAIASSGTAEQKAMLLPKLVTGEWMGTMNLTEPQAGSDLALLKTRAVPDGDRYRIFGQKIFITYGEHDLSQNIIHLVLARIDGAPQGVKGISLFAVPKYLVNADGSLGARNDLRCLSIEHKLGIHASPTCVMAFGEKQGAVGYLLGPPHSGLQFMFLMMNAGRLSVGVQGIAQSERALQLARDWARSRLQGRVEGRPGAVPIVEHPDVRRMLLSMKARTEGMRALGGYTALELDKGHRLADEAARKAALARAELLIPVVKGWCTETAIDVTSTGIQVHGGMGYVEETGAAQFLRDARIATIYEGTTGIQSNDLVGRKLARDGGAAMRALLGELQSELAGSKASGPEAVAARAAAKEGLAALAEATESLLVAAARAPAASFAVSVPYLKLCGVTIAGALMARAATVAEAALAAGTADEPFYRGKLQTSRFYAEQVLPEALGLARVVKAGAASVTEASPELL